MSARIRRARIGAGLTQSELACQVGVRRSAVAQWEFANGTRPTPDHLCAIAQKTGVQFEWLATGRGTSVPDIHEEALEIFDIAGSEVESRMLDAMKRLQPAKQELALRMVQLLVKD